MDDLFTATARGLDRRHLQSPNPRFGEPHSSEHLAASIERAVWRETSGGVYDLKVEVDRDGVRLSGRCRTYYTKQKAQHAAMAFPDSPPLTNLIEVT